MKPSRRLAFQYGLSAVAAGIAWGRVRATRDVDWLAAIPVTRKKEILTLLQAFGEPDWREAGEDDPVSGLIRVVPTSARGIVSDILFARSGADFDALKRCVPVESWTKIHVGPGHRRR